MVLIYSIMVCVSCDLTRDSLKGNASEVRGHTEMNIMKVVTFVFTYIVDRICAENMAVFACIWSMQGL